MKVYVFEGSYELEVIAARSEEEAWAMFSTHNGTSGLPTIRNHEGDVYDPFVGSGTTIVAAEQLGRRCYAMEIDPGYCDVVVRRWEYLTGREAVRDGASIQVHP